ncbi:MAG TPA: hypothetical protein VHG09_14470, partial [Longimicrobiales bacterium]|nr:hypothetical protein [Longimicrobiales bacterium]
MTRSSSSTAVGITVLLVTSMTACAPATAPAPAAGPTYAADTSAADMPVSPADSVSFRLVEYPNEVVPGLEVLLTDSS